MNAQSRRCRCRCRRRRGRSGCGSQAGDVGSGISSQTGACVSVWCYAGGAGNGNEVCCA